MATSDAEKLWKQAEKAREPSVMAMRLKADWESATPLYEKAATAFSLQKNFSRARQAAEKAATGHERQGSSWQAAKQLERAGDFANQIADGAGVKELYMRAGELYMEASRAPAAAQALSKGAKILEEKDPQAAYSMYTEAVQMLEAGGPDGVSGDVYRQAIGCLIRGQKFSEASSMLLKFAVSCEAQHMTSSQCKAYLGAVVVLLYAGNAAEAQATYQDALAVESFTSSKEAFAADDLMEAFRSGDAAQVQKVVADNFLFRELDNQVARLAKKLPNGDLQALASALGGEAPPAPAISKEELDEDDLT
eukprot:jgi/Astpho2/9374/Aster-01643